ncbi:Lrp/AsnC family transcriptional regulator [Pseudoxanthomonas broegbernensis]|uniref:Lrp/AsnC family transcriptional regulator n=1 Tax=Pseudoxanthomonas broegbernensis TaxID=83619 RepID=UPI001390A4F4|nr:Lrp/AsnC family transcriptional regulator [Pseudoxanthomonas broegbernensis]MBB6063512.1 Lrp/AsnC family leucine-responsive transcriptional regulator [Pseudoxanthomonas broegbernensis]
MSLKDTIDRTDLKILQVLQQDARISNQALADRVALSPSACLRRVRELEGKRLITGYHAHVAVDRIRAVTIVLAQVSFERHSPGHFGRFDQWVARTGEVVESWRVSGQYDYMLRVVVTDLHDWKRLMLEMMEGGFGVEKITSNFLMDEMKSFGGYPLAPSPAAG